MAIFVIFVIMALGIVLLSGGSDEKPVSNPTETPQKQLHDYAGSANARVVYTTQGRVVGDDQYRSIRITVTREMRRAEVLDSYTNRVEKSKTLPNNQTAFDVFLRSLEHAGYTTSRKTDITDERGVCPAGRRFIYETLEKKDKVQHTWSTSCGKNLGTFDGNSGAVMQLFQTQITDYNKFISGVSL